MSRKGQTYKLEGQALLNVQAGGAKRRGKPSPNRGKKLNMTPEGSEAIRAANRRNRGKKRTPETRTKMSASMIQLIQEGKLHPEHNSIGGYFFSEKNQKMLHYRSQLELHWYQLLEQFSKVERYQVERVSIPYLWKGSTHLYLPDLLVWYTDVTVELIEIRPEYRRNDTRTLAKFQAAREWCADCRRPIQFRVVGYQELRSLSNELHVERSSSSLGCNSSFFYRSER
jgi:hypothetical protein